MIIAAFAGTSRFGSSSRTGTRDDDDDDPEKVKSAAGAKTRLSRTTRRRVRQNTTNRQPGIRGRNKSLPLITVSAASAVVPGLTLSPPPPSSQQESSSSSNPFGT